MFYSRYQINQDSIFQHSYLIKIYVLHHYKNSSLSTQIKCLSNYGFLCALYKHMHIYVILSHILFLQNFPYPYVCVLSVSIHHITQKLLLSYLRSSKFVMHPQNLAKFNICDFNLFLTNQIFYSLFFHFLSTRYLKFQSFQMLEYNLASSSTF